MVDYGAIKRELSRLYSKMAAEERTKAERRARILDAIAQEIAGADADYAMYLTVYQRIVGKDFGGGTRLPLTPVEWARFIDALGEFGDLLAGTKGLN